MDPSLKVPGVPLLSSVKLISRDWLMGAGWGQIMNYDWSMTIVVDPSDHGGALATARDTSSVGCPFIAMHCKQPGEWLRDKDLAAL